MRLTLVQVPEEDEFAVGDTSNVFTPFEISNYLVNGYISQGGFGTVWKGKDLTD